MQLSMAKQMAIGVIILMVIYALAFISLDIGDKNHESVITRTHMEMKAEMR
jgi:hypothetical protein